MSRTYTPLNTLSVGNGPRQTPIKQCSAVLENRMQCWRAGEVLVTVAAELSTDAEGKPSQTVTQYQLCRRHALIEQEQDAAAHREDETATVAADVQEQAVKAQQEAPKK